MSDPIDTAVNLAKNNKSRLLETGKTAAISAASNIIANNSKLSKLKKLPTTKDPELLKQQAKAEAQKLIGEKQNELQQIKEKKIEELKDKASKLGPLLALGVGLFLKLPTFDPKLLATIAFLKAQKELRELKQKVSKENLKKAKENFTYPIKPPTSLSGIPKIPTVPKIPELPTIPTSLPSLPNIPKIPEPPKPSTTPKPTPKTTPSTPPGISPEDWKRFGDPDTLSFGPESAAKTVAARKASRRAEIIKIQEDRVRKAKEFVDRQAERVQSDPSVQSSYDTAVKVYNNQVTYLEKVKSNPNIVDLTQ